MKQEELKPCPFCGSEDIEIDFGAVVDIAGKEHQDGYVDCLSCGAGFYQSFIDETNATPILVSKWNRRVG